MNSRQFRGVLAGAALAAAAIAAPTASLSAADGPKVTAFQLANGMDAVVIEDNRAPVVTHMVWYRVGAADEPPGKSGIAHFLEHLMFKGTDEIAPGEFSKTIARNGGQDNAFTSLDYTAYFQRIAKDRLDLVMRMEADRMRDLRLDAESVRTEREVVIEERNSRTDNDPESLFYEQMNAAIFLNHPYAIPVIGWRHEIETLSREDAFDFYKQFYGPDNAILVVAGDVTPDEVKALAETHYGVLEPTGVGPRPRPTEPPQLAERRIAMSDPKVRQPFMMRSYLAPSVMTAGPGESEALTVLAEILGGGATSRLNTALVLDQKIAISAGGFYRGMARDATTFTVYGVPTENDGLAAIEAAIDAEIAKLIADGPTEAEMARAKTVLVSSRIYQQDSQSSMARLYGAAFTIGADADMVRDWPDRIRAVDAEAVRAAARSLRREASVTGTLTASKETQ